MFVATVDRYAVTEGASVPGPIKMNRLAHLSLVYTLLATMFATGCSPKQPFFFAEDGDFSHLVTEATNMSFADVDSPNLPQATQTQVPRSLLNGEPGTPWDLSLEEVITIGLKNSKIIRTIGQVRQFRQVGQGAASPPEALSINPDFAATVYDVAIEESGQNGVESALSEFDAQWNTSLFWDETDRPQNVTPDGENFFARNLQRSNMNFQSEITKRAANGTQYSVRNITTYDSNNRPLRVLMSEWLTSLEAEMRHPLLRGGGTQVNRIPVVLARIRTDIALADFDRTVRDYLSELEKSYWELVFFYRNLDAAKVGRDSALLTWRSVNAQIEEGSGQQADAASVAQSQEQYFFFRGRVEEAKRDLLKAERQLRYLMGIEATDGRIIRPSDEPTIAKIEFDWYDVLTETLTRTPEIRRQKWRIKEQEMNLIAAKNTLLPQLDAVALYRFLGLGDDLWLADSDRLPFAAPGSQALENLTDGDYQEWRLGFELNMPIGYRAENARVTNAHLLLARERAKLEDIELELSHSLTDAVQNLDASYQLMKTAGMQGLSSKKQVDALRAQFEGGTVTLDFLLDAQRRLADARVAFFRSLAQYNMSIVEVHFRKGSLAEYCGVMMQEGEWPQKAYVDASIRARQRDASYYLNYGFSRPKVISRGTVPDNGMDASFDSTVSDTPIVESVDRGAMEPTLAPQVDDMESLPNVPEVENGLPTSIPRTPVDINRLDSVLSVDSASAVLPLDAPSNANPIGVHPTSVDSISVDSTSVDLSTGDEKFDWGDLGTAVKDGP